MVSCRYILMWQCQYNIIRNEKKSSKTLNIEIHATENRQIVTYWNASHNYYAYRLTCWYLNYPHALWVMRESSLKLLTVEGKQTI